MNFLDRTISWIAPEMGLRRAKARAMAGIVSRAYDGAKMGRRTDGWTAAGGSANAEIGPALSRLMNRARDLDRNNAHARRAADVWVGNLIGTGIQPTAQGRSSKRTMKAFRAWSKVCDVDGRHDFTGLQTLAARTMVVSGAAIIRRYSRRSGEMPGQVPLQLQVLEPDYIDIARTESGRDGGWITQGVEFNARGQRVAYWLFGSHPGEVNVSFTRNSLISQRVPAEDVVHLYRVDRPGQIHGVPWVAPVMMPLRDIADYGEAERVRKKIEACNTAFVMGSAGEAPPIAPATTDPNGNQVETFEPGMILRLKPGEDIKFNTPAASGGYGEYMRTEHRAVATGLGLMYEHLTGDLSGVNYSSYRAGDLVSRTLIETLRWQAVIPVACDPLWSWFTDAAWLAGAIPDQDVPVVWTPPKFESIDREKDANGDLIEIRMGTKTWPQAVAERGYDPDQQIEEIVTTQKKLDEAGVVLDIDARKLSRNGNRDSKPAAAEPATP